MSTSRCWIRRVQIEFPYYYENGAQRAQEPMAFGEGLTSRIIETRAPLLLNRARTGTRSASVASAPRPSPIWACRSSSATGRSARSASRARPRRAGSGRPTTRVLVDDRRERRRRDPERPAVPGGPSPRRRDGGPRRGRPGDLGDARCAGGPRADRRAGPDAAGRPTRPRSTWPSRTAGRSGRSSPSARSPTRSWPTTITEGEGIIGDAIRRRGPGVGQRRRTPTRAMLDDPRDRGVGSRTSTD